MKIILKSCQRSWQDFVQALMRKSCADLGEICSQRSLHVPVQVLNGRSCGDTGTCIIGASMKALLGGSWKVLGSRSCKILFGVLAWRSWSKSLTYNSLWKDLVEILVKSSKRSLQCMILYRSLWEDLVKILLTSSLRGPCIKTLEDDVRWWLYESSSGMLIASSCMKISKILYLDGPSLTIFWISLRCPCMGFWYDE